MNALIKMEYQFIDKSLYLPEKGILVVGDLHIGYDYMIQQSGVLVPENQIHELIEELEKIITEIKSKPNNLKKIIFLGDIKHSFAYDWKEKNYFREVFEFLGKHFKSENIIFIKGNHDTIDYTFSNKLKEFYIEGGIAFVHGHKSFIEIFDKDVKKIVMGHIHPSILLSDKQGIKREKFKCFLTGKFKNKEVIILPSFLSTLEGQTINTYETSYEDYFSIIPKKALIDFNVFIVGEDQVYEFGRVKSLTRD